MAATIEELEGRLAALEQEVARLRRVVEPPDPVGGERPPLPHQSDQAVISAAVARAFAAMGITGTPLGAEKVQRMIADCGVKPEDNAFSRGIIEAREE
jgi:hypothetical protein